MIKNNNNQIVQATQNGFIAQDGPLMPDKDINQKKNCATICNIFRAEMLVCVTTVLKP